MNNEDLRLKTIVAGHKDIQNREMFFGLFPYMVYTPTDSKLTFKDKYYLPPLFTELKDLFDIDESTLIKRAATGFHYEDNMNGNLRIEACMSDDNQFVAIRLQRFSELLYHSITDVRFFTGEAAQAICQMLG